MKEVRVLDCTLRDGGYCNDCQFGFRNARYLVDSLVQAGVDVIECGFLTQRTPYQEDFTRFNTMEQAARLIPQDRRGRLFVGLLDYGAFSPDDLPEWDGSTLDGIRVTFHKKDRDPALALARQIQAKGYKVFLQPMVALSYTDQEYLDLIEKANALGPYAFYLVDSFGTMKRKEMLRFFYMLEHNLDPAIHIGFHSHNNLQLAYANAQTLADLPTGRSLLIDASIMGMGRGAGNLNTELFLDYLNDSTDKTYQIKPLLRAIDRVLGGFYQQRPWGYSLPNYLSASYNAHPSYALFLAEKNTLTAEDIDRIFSRMPPEKRVSFDRDFIEDVYLRYMEHAAGGDSLAALGRQLSGKSVLLIAPGKSAGEEREKILHFARERNPVTISVNFKYPYLATDFIFLSNLRRRWEMGKPPKSQLIVTSNIPQSGEDYRVDYSSLLNTQEPVRDNAGLMLIQLLVRLGAKEIWLAGMDGYSHDPDENYLHKELRLSSAQETLDAMNRGMRRVLSQLARQTGTAIRFLTKPQRIFLPGEDTLADAEAGPSGLES